MNRFALSLLLLWPLMAQAADIKSLGRPMDNDVTPLRDRYVYFYTEATDPNITLDRPILSSEEIEDWLRQHVAEALALNGTAYEQEIIAGKRYFTPKGYGEYIATLENAALPDLLKKENYIISAVVIDKPEIVVQGLRDITPAADPAKAPPRKQYQYVWQAKVPTLLSYTKGQDVRSYNVVVELEVVRTQIQQDGNKIAINTWRFGEATEIKKPENKTQAVRSYSRKSRFAF